MITIDRAPLADAAQQCARIAARSDYPLQLQAAKGTLSLRVASHEQWLTLTLPCKGDLGKCSVDPAKFASVIGALFPELVGMELADGSLKITAGESRRSLALTRDELPERDFEGPATITLDGDMLGEAISFTLPNAASPDDIAKAFVAGVHLRGDGKTLKAYATDGKTLAIIEAGECADAFGVTISHKTAEIVSRLSGPIEIALNDRAAEFRWNGGRLVSSIIETEYPVSHIEKAMTLEWDKSASFEAPAFLNAVRGVRMLGEHDTSAKSERLLLTLNGSATLHAQSTGGNAIEEFPADFDGDEFSIGIIASQAERLLRGFGDVVLDAGFIDPLQPIRLTPAGRTDRLALLYPVKM